jgi:hypothetical protein
VRPTLTAFKRILKRGKAVRSSVRDLKIVWRNPLPLIRTKRTLQRIRRDQFGAVYAVTALDLTQELEVIVSQVA